MNIFLHKPSPYLFIIIRYVNLFLSMFFVARIASALLLPNVLSRAINYYVIDYFELSFGQL